MSDASTSQTLEHGVRVHRLDGTDVTLLFLGHSDGLPEIAYWGPRLQAIPDLDALAIAMSRPIAQAALDKDYPGATLLPAVGARAVPGHCLCGASAGAGLDRILRGPGDRGTDSDGLLIKAHDPVARIGLEWNSRFPQRATCSPRGSRSSIKPAKRSRLNGSPQVSFLYRRRSTR